jgi:hypothetical protein
MKQLGLYTALKYIEFGVTALLTILLSARVSAEEYGAAAIFFLSVTYLQFASFGANQVLVKWYSTRKDEEGGLVSINLMFWTTLLACLLILLVSVCMGSLMFFYAAAVASLKLLYEAFVNIFRVTEKLQRINMLSFLFSVLFLSSTFLFAFSVQSYFLSWLGALVVSIAWALFLLPSKVLKLQLFLDNVGQVSRFLGDGVMMLMINFVTLSLTTFDRGILNLVQVPKAYVGSVQLVDTITNGVILSVTSVMFVLLPRIYSMMRKAEIQINKLYLRSVGAVVLFLALMLGGYFVVLPWVSPFISKYPNFSWYFSLQLVAKSILLLTTIPYSYMVVNSRELMYFRIYATWLCLTLLAYLVVGYMVPDKTAVSFFLNSTLLVVSILLNLHLYFVMKKNYR